MPLVSTYNGRQNNTITAQVKDFNFGVGQTSIGINSGTPVNDTWLTSQVAGTYSRLYFRTTSDAATSDSHFRYIHGGATPSNGNENVVVTHGVPGEYTDAVNTDVCSVNDQVSCEFTNGGGGTVTDSIQGPCFTPTANTSQWFGSFNTIASSSTETFYRLGAISPSATTETAAYQTKSKVNGTAKFSNVGLVSNSSSSDTTYGMRLNGADSTCFVTVTHGVAAQTVDGGTNNQNIAVADLINRFATQPAASSGTAAGLFCFVIQTTDSTTMDIATAPTGDSTYAAGVTKYEPLTGQLQATTTELNTEAPVQSACTISQAETYVTTNTITADAAIRIRKSGSYGNLNIPVTAGAANQWFEDATHSDAVGIGTELCWEVKSGATGTTLALTVIADKRAFATPILRRTLTTRSGSRAA